MTRAVVRAAHSGWAALRQDVLERDRACVFAPIGRPAGAGIQDHTCRTRYGEAIDWSRVSAADADVELDHVKEEPAAGVKAKDDSAHLVTVCWCAHHLGLATGDGGRRYERAWLAFWYPEVWATFLERQGIA